MNASGTCPECGRPVVPNGLQGLCPECMMKVGLDTPSADGEGDCSQRRSAPPLAEVARLFPQLEILECLGCGGMGAVYKARQLRLDRLVALKILIRGRASEERDAHFAERFEREARALAKLNHPNIVAVHEFGEAGSLPYLIMEYVDGVNLRQLEQAGKIAPAEALKVVPQICEALQFAHDNGVVHRDIKPENILLEPNGKVKIADFGIAKILGRPGRTATLTQDRQVVGTPHYMAPEQVEHPQAVDHRADIYSLGVVFYEMLTGELPLGKFAPPSRKVQVDLRLDEVVLRTLEKEPERRYQRASEVKTDVETISTKPSANPSLPDHKLAPGLAKLRIASLLSAAACFGIVVALTQFIENDLVLGLSLGGAAGCLIAAYRYWKWPAAVTWAGSGRLGKGPLRSPGFWAGAGAILGVALLVWLAAPKFPSFALCGTVSDSVTGKPIARATVAVMREGELVRQCRADAEGRFELVWPHNANVLYRSRNGSLVHSVDLAIVASAPGYQSSSIDQSSTQEAGYYRRRASFKLRSTRDSGLTGAEDVAEVIAEEKLASGDPNRRFFLIGPKPGSVFSTNGQPLLLVLPGGDGGPDFLTFVKRIYLNGVPEGYLVAELIAPRWDEKQADQIVWPTTISRYPNMKFSTEAFIESVISEIEKQQRLDRRRIFTLSWSSGGPAAYAASLYRQTRITGSLIAMSVFHPPGAPALKLARGQSYFLLHSPDDALVPIAMANHARDALMENGAQATLVTYPGGHGWIGDVYGNIRAGIGWLEEHAALRGDNSLAVPYTQ